MKSLDQTPLLVKAVFVVVALNAAANAFNDYRDLDADRINRQDRPLPQGKIPPQMALWSAVVLFGIGILISGSINQTAFVIATFIATPLMVAYSLWMKGWPLIGNAIVALILGLAFIFTGAAFGNARGMLIPALLAFGFTLIRELVKDIADIEGDEAVSLQTFPIRFGVDKSVILVIAFIVALSIGTLLPFWLGIYGKPYLIVLTLGIELPLLFIVFLLVKSPSIATCKTSSQILKACIFAGLLAIYVG